MKLLHRMLMGKGGGVVPATELAALLAQLRAGNSHTGTGNITVSATANRTSGVAPLGVMFDATATATILTAIPFHELIHIWHYGDDDTATWQYGTMPGVSKKNLGEGAIGAHVFETPGTKTVRYTPAYVSSGGVLSVGATQTITITVDDPDVVFAGANTICLANGTTPVAGVNGVPAGATCASASDWEAVLGYCRAGKRVLLKAGDTWTHGTSIQFLGGATGTIGKFGVGADPKVSITAVNVALIVNPLSAVTDWRFMDIECTTSGLSSVGGAAAGTSFIRCLDLATFPTAGGSFTTMLRINHHDAAAIGLITSDTILADCRAERIVGGAGNVGLWCSQSYRLGVLGCTFDDCTLVEMNIRLQGVNTAVISDSLIRDPAATGQKHALALRGFAGADGAWTGVYTEKVVVRQNRITGNSISGLVQLAPQNSVSDERHRDIVVDGNFISNTCAVGNGTLILISGGSNHTIRNNILENSPDSTLTAAIAATDVPSIPSISFAGLTTTEVYVYNNVLYCSKTTSSGTSAKLVNPTSSSSSGFQVKNNVMYLPNHTNGGNSVVGGAGAGGCTTSNNSTNAQTRLTPNFVNTPPVVYTDWRCTSGYSIDSGAYVPVFTDFFGVARTGTRDMGAINP